jgi:uncharacterized protein
LSSAGPLVVAALSARVLAQAASQAGHRVLALDCFGDVDTQRASAQWWPINQPGAIRIAPQRFLSALADAKARHSASAWVAGAGFEGQPELLAQGASLLPLLGMSAEEVRRVRDAKAFFSGLDEAHIAHPEVRWALPHDTTGWWVKDAGGCGGWHIRAAHGLRELPAACYVQRDAAGTPMSATLVGDGQHIQLLGINRQIMRQSTRHPFVYAGVVGPVAVPQAVTQRVVQIAQQLANDLHWRGLVSLDFLLDGDQVQVLELNPRPPASLVLYPGALAAHLQACIGGGVPPGPWRVDGVDGVGSKHTVRGQRIVFAPKALRLSAALAHALARWPHVHDVPQPGQHCRAGDPLCSVQVGVREDVHADVQVDVQAAVQAQAHSAHAASALLQQRHDDVLAFLENHK